MMNEKMHPVISADLIPFGLLIVMIMGLIIRRLWMMSFPGNHLSHFYAGFADYNFPGKTKIMMLTHFSQDVS